MILISTEKKIHSVGENSGQDRKQPKNFNFYIRQKNYKIYTMFKQIDC